MKKKQSMDYDPLKFPNFDFGHVLPPKINPTKIQGADFSNCLSLAVYMASQIDDAEGSINLRVDRIQSGYFRAALAELIRVEDIATQAGRRFAFVETDEPLLHIIKLLRNYNVHIGSSALSAGGVSVQYGDEVGVHESFIVKNLSAQRLQGLRQAKDYSQSQLEELMALFEEGQRKFGVVQLLYNTCLHVAHLLANRGY